MVSSGLFHILLTRVRITDSIIHPNEELTRCGDYVFLSIYTIYFGLSHYEAFRGYQMLLFFKKLLINLGGFPQEQAQGISERIQKPYIIRGWQLKTVVIVAM